MGLQDTNLAENGWLDLEQLRDRLNVKYDTLKKWVQRGKFKRVRRVKSDVRSRGGLRVQIHITDPAIPEHVKEKFYSELIQTTQSNSEQYYPITREGAEESRLAPPANSVKRGRQVLPKNPENQPAAGSASTSRAQSSGADAPREERGISFSSTELMLYRSSPKYMRERADFYIELLRLTEGMKGNALKTFIKTWNTENPERTTSYQSLMRARKQYKEQGMEGLLGNYGNRSGDTTVKDEWFDYFKAMYLKQGAPSAYSSWLAIFGMANRREGVTKETFPSSRAFLRRMQRELPADAIYLARHGYAKYNRKYANHIERDNSNIRCGEVWVADHAQIDVAVMMPDGKPTFPWITAWSDLKSRKILGWYLHAEPPNSDHIFQSIYFAMLDHGIPKHIYIDNGKDFRSKAFAGGRNAAKLEVNEQSARSLVQVFGITTHFALPYRAQSKNIERNFLQIKEHLSKHVAGYRGGNITERPEDLQKQISQGKIFSFDEFSQVLEFHIHKNFNQHPSQGKDHKGKSPDELYESEADNRFAGSWVELSIFCLKSSSTFTIGRNGIKDSKKKCSFWGEWMAGQKGRKVYYRGNPLDLSAVCVHSADNDEYLGLAAQAGTVPSIAVTEEDQIQLTNAISVNRQVDKIAKTFATPPYEISSEERIVAQAAGVEALNKERGYSGDGKQKERKPYSNGMAQKVIDKEAENQKFGKARLGNIAPPPKKEEEEDEKIYAWAWQKEEAERKKKKDQEENK